MKYATAALAAALLCSGAASAQSISDIGQYHRDKSNMQNASDVKPAKADASANAAATVTAPTDGTACQAGAAGTANAAAQAANGAAQGNAQCSTTNPPAVAPQAQPAPQ